MEPVLQLVNVPAKEELPVETVLLGKFFENTSIAFSQGQ